MFYLYLLLLLLNSNQGSMMEHTYHGEYLFNAKVLDTFSYWFVKQLWLSKVIVFNVKINRQIQQTLKAK